MEEPLMSSISGISSSMIRSMFTQGIQSRTDPAQKLKELDTDSNGGLDKTELSSMAQDLSKMTGQTLKADDMMTTYDTNNDGLLSQDEVGKMMQQVLPPPNAGPGVSSQQAAQTYQANSGDDQISLLMKMLGQTSGSSSTSTSGSNQLSSLLSMLSQTADSSSTGSSSDSLSTLLNMLGQSAGSSSADNARPSPEEMFKKLDSDGSGGLNTSELDAWAKDFKPIQTIDTAKAISTYDANGDGELSKTEMDTMMKALQEKSGGPPPPPDMVTGIDSVSSGEATSQQTTNTSQTNVTNDQLSLLRQLLDQYTANFSTDSLKSLTSYI
jgi:Ca2+-binding EF-hand superfamily protein